MTLKNQKYDDPTLIKWIKNSQKIGNGIVSNIFSVYLESMIKNGWKGACHDLSASFYMTLSEFGFKPTLCIGVIDINGSNYDHSWVEIEGNAYDFTICNQNYNSVPPVFKSINLDNLKISSLIYGVKGINLGEPANNIASLSINDYDNIRPENSVSMYEIASEYGNIIGHPENRILRANELEIKYSNHKRTQKY